jgi:DNA-binding IclR family transcriptional regulator
MMPDDGTQSGSGSALPPRPSGRARTPHEADRIRDGHRARDAARVRDRRPSVATATKTSPPSTAVGTLDRIVDVIDAVERGARSYTDIVAATGMTKATAHRLVRALEQHGLLLHLGGVGYTLGPRLLALAVSATRDLPLRDLARPALERLARVTGESAQLYVRDGARRVCVDAVHSESELRTIVAVGASLPLTKGSAGRVFLAYARPTDVERLLEQAPPPWAAPSGSPPSAETPTRSADHDAVDPVRLARILSTVRRRGWADSVGEREPGVASVSAPIFGPAGDVLAVISVSGPASRIGQLRGKHYAPAVTVAAREVEATLGTSDPDHHPPPEA